jgi:ABC-type transporter Mla subunit MlaD
LFSVVGIVAIFAVFIILTGAAQSVLGYELPISFNNTAGLREGSQVFESGVAVGTVRKIELRPDYTALVVIGVRKGIPIPRDAHFLIQAPLTGDPTLLILPPVPPKAAFGARPHGGPESIAVFDPATATKASEGGHALAVGDNPVSVADLLTEGQQEVKRLDDILAGVQKTEPQLIAELTSAVDNANQLSVGLNRTFQHLAGRLDGVQDQFGSTLATVNDRVLDLTKVLDDTAHSSADKSDKLLTNLQQTSVALNDAVEQLRLAARNPDVRKNLVRTTEGIAAATETLAEITNDFRQVTGNQQTQAQLRDVVANLDATSQRTNSLLAMIGGRSSVYGIDPGATPAPGTTIPPGTATPLPGASPLPGAAPAVPPNLSALSDTLKKRLAGLTRNLVGVDVRLSEYDKKKPGTPTTPLLTRDRGPLTDFNVVVLPKNSTSLTVGANDIGGPASTLNLLGSQKFANGLTVGGGVLYSRLGLLTSYQTGALGVEGRVYDVRTPTVDAYGKIRPTSFLELFAGERDLARSTRRTVYGLDFKF